MFHSSWLANNTAYLLEPDQKGGIAVKHRANLVGADTAFEHQADIGAHSLDRQHREYLAEIGAHETAFRADLLHGLRHFHGIERRLAMHHVHEGCYQAVIALDQTAEIGEIEQVPCRQTGHRPSCVADDDLPHPLVLCLPDHRPALDRREVRRSQAAIAFLDHADHLARLGDQLALTEHGDRLLLRQAEIDAGIEALAVFEMIACVPGREMDHLRAVAVTQGNPDGARIDAPARQVHYVRAIDRDAGAETRDHIGGAGGRTAH